MARIVKSSALVKVPRGRKADVDPDLLAVLKALKPNEGVIFDTEFGEVPKGKRSTVSAILRRHWAMTGREKSTIGISYSPEGYPQVEAKA